MILDLLQKKNIAVNVEAADWKEVVAETGKLLLEAGQIEKRYIEAMKQSIIDNGPYVVIGKGIALLHARPEDGVKENCLSLITLAEPVEFGNKNNDPVKIAFAFGTVDNEKHVKTISELSVVLMEESAVDNIAEMGSAGEILSYIEDILAQQ
ncbi:MAG: phosphotransferase system mannitol/fructose-specifc IIA component (Ntr-type) [Halanaerobium sp. 4-GBenrich]|uniref:Ascorbate-specific PTS system EIIA component n=1 Tax=Halanaerobium congolense TaxID=54121 RepID=A0A1G6QYK2_9FIRM|nr:PTS sugar transporter subunit IIA [Halanaerobium congolense]KXS48578.1 MAG: phosphotransferase system mannitol/fructose-specifc IIA component (Ntr-type) [Halanaerobium sp. T82-1]ODS50437.1 MAG: phosphotransferase system mannitol/fructose-specifc IIA component (Ntr-type) [Halanaerobium sp. 4-GBenrich]OEG63309.1 MAG: PTS fructose transporter subunit IIA [Halanaerobium sp. MDAL1]PUU91675.1 MAG: phosphotransferase system mannitol/fructose-specifc IIA component (Ntr-type) [Halanaerobium sp.]PTX1